MDARNSQSNQANLNDTSNFSSQELAILENFLDGDASGLAPEQQADLLGRMLNLDVFVVNGEDSPREVKSESKENELSALVEESKVEELQTENVEIKESEHPSEKFVEINNPTQTSELTENQLLETKDQTESLPETTEQLESKEVFNTEQEEQAEQLQLLSSVFTEAENKNDDRFSELQQLQKELDAKQSPWKISLECYINSELDLILDNENDSQLQATKTALVNLLRGKIQDCSNDNDVLSQLTNLLEFLTIQLGSEKYESIVERDKYDNNILPSVHHIRLATLNLLEKCYKERNLRATASQKVKCKVVYLDKPFFIKSKQYTYNEMLEFANQLLLPYKITATPNQLHFNILVYLLTLSGNIKEFSKWCTITSFHYADSGRGLASENRPIWLPGYFHLHFYEADKIAAKFAAFYTKRFGVGMINRAIPYWKDSGRSFSININKTVELILSDEFKKTIEELFVNPDVLKNFQEVCSTDTYKSRRFVDLTQESSKTLNAAASRYHLSGMKSDCVEAALCTAFGIDLPEQDFKAQFQHASRYADFIDYQDFLLSLSIPDAEKLVAAINTEFPNAAKLTETNARLENKGDTDLQVVAIKNRTLMSNEFLDKVNAGFKKLREINIELYEKFEIESDLRKFTTKQISSSLSNLGEEFKTSDNKLSDSLAQLSLFVSQRKEPEIKQASFEVKKAIAAHESNCATIEEYSLFKTGKKQEIKQLQNNITCRPN